MANQEGPPREAGPGPAAAAAAEAPPSPSTAAASASASASATEEAAPELPELPLFSCKEAYVYRVPPATTAGHRAELWDVNKWLATVSIKVMQADDECFIRLLDNKTGELFAECPVPTDHRPLLTAVEPVVDSSRYFVMRIVDRDSKRHAFIGIGFRERSEASDFNAALYEFLQYIKRKRTADAMRSAYEERLQSAGSGVEGEGQGAAAALPAADYSIKEGETLTLKIATTKRAGSGGFVSGKKGLLGKQFSLIMDGHGGTVAALSPPPGSSGRRPSLDMCVTPSMEGGGGSPLYSSASSEGSAGGLGLGPGFTAMPRLSGAGDGELQQRLRSLRLQQQQEGPPSSNASVASGSPAAVVSSAAATDDDDFGEFEAA